MIEQIIILLTGPASIWWINDPRREYRKWACMAAMLGQPAWLYAAWTAGQWGIFIMDLLYIAGWYRGFKQYWFPKEGKTNGER